MKKIRIARNDPTLAHAAAREGLKRLDFSGDMCVLRAAQTGSLKGAFREIRKARPVCAETLVRGHGSRAKGNIAYLDAIEGGGGLVVVVASYDARREPPLQIARTNVFAKHEHVLARIFQREIGEADERAALDKLLPYFDVFLRFTMEVVRTPGLA